MKKDLRSQSQRENLSSGQSSLADDTARREQEAGLINDCLAGDSEAIGRLVTAYTRWVQSGAEKALKETRARVACEVPDLVQNFFMQLSERIRILRKYDPDRPLGPWLSGVAHHWSENYLRSREVRWQDRTPIEMDAEAPPGDEPALGPIDPALIVAKILDRFSSTTRDIVQAKYGIGQYNSAQSVAEIAERRGITKRKVYSHLARMHRVRNCLSHSEIEEIEEFLENVR